MFKKKQQVTSQDTLDSLTNCLTDNTNETHILECAKTFNPILHDKLNKLITKLITEEQMVAAEDISRLEDENEVLEKEKNELKKTM